jgi:hypothetical protein
VLKAHSKTAIADVDARFIVVLFARIRAGPHSGSPAFGLARIRARPHSGSHGDRAPESGAQYHRLRQHLRAFPDPQLAVGDYEEAAQANNRCRAQGVAGSAIDFLICALAMRRNWPVFTTDWDFLNYARVLPISLYRPRGNGGRPG